MKIPYKFSEKLGKYLENYENGKLYHESSLYNMINQKSIRKNHKRIKII